MVSGKPVRSFAGTRKMAVDVFAPKEFQELGRALQRVMLGERDADLSSLPREWAEAIQRLAFPKDIGTM